MATPLLRLLQIDLTDECTLVCGHCSNQSGPGRRGMFHAGRLLQIVKEAGSLGVSSIVFSGGEPLLHPRLKEAIAAASMNGIRTTIFTTGISDRQSRLPMPSTGWKELVDSGLRTATFSVYAAPSNREFHNEVVGLAPVQGDAFGINEEAVKNAIAAGLQVDMHYIPSDRSVGDLAGILHWASELGCATLHLQVPTFQGRNSPRNAVLSLSDSSEARIRIEALPLVPSTGRCKLYISRFWMRRWELEGGSGCAANPEQIIIRADGRISPCNACKYGLGTSPMDSMLGPGTSLTSIWEGSEDLQSIRDAAATGRLPFRCEGTLATKPDQNASVRPRS